jgi:mannosyltransferase OCH1-like enzyme
MQIYTTEPFDQLIRKSDQFDEKKYLSDSRWKILEQIYNQNYLSNTNTKTQIPKIIHHIWLGSDLPKEYEYYISTWKKYHPDWKHYLWTDKHIKDLNLFNIKLYNQTKNNGQKSDILRYELLYRFGGVYVDTDFECLKPFDELMVLKFFTGISHQSDIEMYIGLIASCPKHPIIRSCLREMKDISWKTPIDVMSTTGNYFFTRCFIGEMDYESQDIVAFPTDYFYPFSNILRDKVKGKERMRSVRECSYAIHHWGVSWV